MERLKEISSNKHKRILFVKLSDIKKNLTENLSKVLLVLPLLLYSFKPQWNEFNRLE